MDKDALTAGELLVALRIVLEQHPEAADLPVEKIFPLIDETLHGIA